MDFKKLYEIFVEEASEHLENLEHGLLELEKKPDDAELLNSIFRAAHTIKGSSGSLGLMDISAFMHVMEEILDATRNGELTPNEDMISALLEATDLIKDMVASVAEGRTFEFSLCSESMYRLKSIKESGQAFVSKAEDQFSAETAFIPVGNEKTFFIRFRPASDVFKRGLDPAMIIENLRGIGSIMDINAHSEAVPRLSLMDPENLYLRWDFRIKTKKDEPDIRKVFDFIEEGSDITITHIKDSDVDIPLLGKLLIEERAVKKEDVEEALKAQKKLGEILVEHGKVAEGDIEKILDKQNTRKIESFRSSVTSSIRVDLGKLDNLVNLVGEMVIIHSMFQQLMQDNVISESASHSGAEKFDVIFSQLQRIGRDIQEGTMSLRMLPVGEVFQRFGRLVRELSSTKGKDIELVVSGEETELDKGVLEKIADPLVHLIRNSIDHGIETPEARAAANKHPKATIFLRAYQMGDAVYIEVEDDGRGLNKEKILAKAIAKGLVSNSVGLTDDQIYNFVFLPGFSTADVVTDVSGRGVGMDVVRKNINALNGSVQIKTIPGSGTIMSIRLPLTLAIIDGLVVSVGNEVFIIPITSVVESFRPAKADIKTIEESGEVVNVRGEYMPLIRLNNLLNQESSGKEPWEAIVVVTHFGDGKFAMLVDGLIGEQQVVLKNLGKATPKVRDIAGGTIMGDGRVALVLDVAGLVEMATN